MAKNDRSRSVIVEAHGTSSPNPRSGVNFIEAAMAAAAAKAQADGITDPYIIRERMKDAISAAKGRPAR